PISNGCSVPAIVSLPKRTTYSSCVMFVQSRRVYDISVIMFVSRKDMSIVWLKHFKERFDIHCLLSDVFLIISERFLFLAESCRDMHGDKHWSTFGYIGQILFKPTVGLLIYVPHV